MVRSGGINTANKYFTGLRTVRGNTILPQIIVTFVIKIADITVNTQLGPCNSTKILRTKRNSNMLQSSVLVRNLYWGRISNTQCYVNSTFLDF